MLPRTAALGTLFALEMLAITARFDGDSLPGHLLVVSVVRDYGPATLRFLVSFIVVFAAFAYLRSRPLLHSLSLRVEGLPVKWPMVALHSAAMASFFALGSRLYGNQPSNGMAVLFLLAGVCGIVSAAVALIPLAVWFDLARQSRALFLYGFAAAAAANFATHPSRTLWGPFMELTFRMVRWMVAPLVPGLTTDFSIMKIATPNFSVRIAAECSGLEGAGLMLVFGLVWLWLFREEMRFPQSLALLPLGVVAIFLLNAIRIAALILIGNAGAPSVALGGFHSQAGWILFNLVAFGLCVLSLYSPWFAAEPRTAARAAKAEDNAVPYLLPFLAILAAGMIAHAASSNFEWLYPLRVVAALACLYLLRSWYRELTWTVHWIAPLCGIAVFLIWIAPGLWTHTAGGTMPAALASSSPWARYAWIAARLLGAVIIVPIAEELAFRAFLLRRLATPSFTTISPQAVGWAAIGISSFLFGLMHGGRWMEGTVAGALYAYSYRRSGSLGDAVAAHATTNALLAGCVLGLQQWSFW